MNRRISAFLVCAAMGMTAFAFAAPVASAHECETYDEKKCDPNGCTEGENHKHIHLRRWYEGDDEKCQSSADPNDPNGCSIFEVDDWPEAVCDLVDEKLTPDALLQGWS